VTGALLGRRAFLVGITAAGGAVLATGASLVLSDPAASIHAIIAKRLGVLTFEPEGLGKFVGDYVEQNEARISDRRWQFFRAVLPLYRHTGLLKATPMARYLYRRESEVVSALLLSSDFFMRADQSPESTKITPIRYLGWYEDNLCTSRNPFARFDFPSDRSRDGARGH